MNDADIRAFAQAAQDLLRPHLERSESLRTSLRLLGQWLVEQSSQIHPIQTLESPVASEPQARVEPAPPVAPSPPPIPRATPTPARDPIEPPAPRLPQTAGIVPLKLGGLEVHLPVPGTTAEIGRARSAAIEPRVTEDDATPSASYPDLALVEERSRLKEESCRVVVRRRSVPADSDEEVEIRQRVRELLATAKATPNCFLWMFWQEREQPADGDLTLIADAYLAHADAVALVQHVDELALNDLAVTHDAFQLLAEASSALRAALDRSWLTKPDFDQDQTHLWLRYETATRRVRLERYMMLTDPADATQCRDLVRRIKLFAAQLDQRTNQSKAVKTSLNQIRFHSGQIVKNPSEDPAPHWHKIATAITALRDLGLSVSDRRLIDALAAESLAHWSESHPDAPVLSPLIRAVQAKSKEDLLEAAPAPKAWSPAVLKAREWLRGKVLVLVGGIRNPEAVRSYLDAFELREVEWMSLPEHSSSAPLQAPIARADTALVVLLIQLIGHHHADDARDFARNAAKPCIHLTAGYNPEQVAHAIENQASARLQQT